MYVKEGRNQIAGELVYQSITSTVNDASGRILAIQFAT